MAFYYYDTTGRHGPFNRTQLQIQVNNRKVLKETPVETEDGQRGLAGQLVWLVFSPIPKPWWQVIFGLSSGLGRFVSWILNTVLLLLAVTVLAAAIGIAVCVIVYKDTPWVVMGYVPPTISCSSPENYRESVRRTKDWWYSKQDKDTREDHKETMSELQRLAAALKEKTLVFADVQEAMLEEVGKKTIEGIDAKDLSKAIDKWIKEKKVKDEADGAAAIEAAAAEARRKAQEEFDSSRVASDTIDKMKNSEFGKVFNQDCDFLSNSLSWSQQDLLAALNGKTAKEVHAYREDKETFLKLTVSRDKIDKMLTDDQFKQDWDYLSGNGQESEELKNECEKLKDTAKKSEFLKKLKQLSKGKTKDELLSELNGKNFAEVHRYRDTFASNLEGKYADVRGEINDALKEQLGKDERERLEKEWQKKLAELKAKAAQAKPRAVWLTDELKRAGFGFHQTGDYIRYGTYELYDAYRKGGPIERNKLEPQLKFPPTNAAKKIFKNNLDLSIGEPSKDGNGWSVNISYGAYVFGYFKNYHFTYQTYFGVHTAGSAWRDIRTTLKCSEATMTSFMQNKSNYDVVVVFGNLHLKNNDVCADLISADIVEKETEIPVVNLYPETKLAVIEAPVAPDPPGVGIGIEPVGTTSVTDKAQQIQEIVNGFLAMNPGVEVQSMLATFQDKIMPQIQGRAAGGQIIQIAPAFLFHGERKQPQEPFHIGAFFDLPKDKQFETIYRLTYGSQNIVNPHPRDESIFAAMKRFRNRIAADKKKNQPPAAVADAEPPKQ